jgi:V-type H+-transporting ATPase subunit E
MINFIKQHGAERVSTIERQAQDEFTIQKEKYFADEKENLVLFYKNKLAQDEIKLKIAKSAEQNAARIQKMRTVNSLIEKLYVDAKRKMVEKIKDKASYKELLKNLLIQVIFER